MIAKMLLSGSFNVNYAYTGEVFPTLIRNQAYGSCSFVSRIAAVLTPFLIHIGYYVNNKVILWYTSLTRNSLNYLPVVKFL